LHGSHRRDRGHNHCYGSKTAGHGVSTVQTHRQQRQTSTVGAYNSRMVSDPRIHVVAVALAAAAGGLAIRAADMPKQLIAHRGASGYTPEHTRAAYQLALDQRADYVEQDLAVTRDGELICLHDDSLERTSNVAEVFPDRATTATGRRGPVKQWLANDFSLDEIRRLDMGRWFNAKFAGQRIVTWQEAIDLVRGKAGLYPELKSPPLYTNRGVDMVKLFVESVKKNGLDRPESLKTTPMIIQSFDEPTVRRIAQELPGVPRILLMESFGSGMSDARLRELKTFATGIGPAKALLEAQPDVVQRAHAAGLTVTAYTFRSVNSGRFPSVRDEMSHYLYTLGIDALFTDNPDQFPRKP
jgi:glycerophosphoryl diester phosphodiesterase